MKREVNVEMSNKQVYVTFFIDLHVSEWSVGRWIAGVMSFLKMYGLYGLKYYIVEISEDVTNAGRTNKQTTREDRATQFVNCYALSLAICILVYQGSCGGASGWFPLTPAK